MTNIVVANLAKSRFFRCPPLYQYNYGMVLKITGIQLPDAYEVDFANDISGQSITQIGNADGVTIPSQFFTPGQAIYAWLRVHPTQDSGITTATIVIPISPRATITDDEPTPEEQSAIDQAIAALNDAVDRADEAVEHYPKIENGVWYVWDVDSGEYVSTGITAQGPQGEQGIQGIKGDTGATGPQGPQGDDYVLTAADKAEIAGMIDAPVTDVQVNGTSILNNGVANVPVASNDTPGVVKSYSVYGISQTNGFLSISQATDAMIKAGTDWYKPIGVRGLPASIFYGLAKLAGIDLASGSDTVGVYPDAAKVAIEKMLGIYQAPWELIREDTFTNITEADHIITVDGNGEAFELTDVVLLFETPKQSTVSKKGYYGQVQYKHNGSNVVVISSTTWTQNADADPYGFYQFIERKDGLIFASGTQATVSGTPSQLRFTPIANLNDQSAHIAVVPASTRQTITDINIKSVTGTGHYRLYGKRKWQ